MSRSTLTALALVLLLFPARGKSAEVEQVPGRWPAQKARAWYDAQPWLVGCNYIPATAINQLEMWQADTFDMETMTRELGWAKDLGFNTLRVYLHDLVWKQDAAGLYQRIDRFLTLCDNNGIKVLFVFFDDCHRPDPVAGVQPPCVKSFHNSGWAKSPARELLMRYHDGKASAEEKAYLKGYVQETMRRFKDDKRVLLWELYNEPGRSAGKRSVPLLMDAWRWAREVNPSQPLCSTAEGSKGKVFIDIARANSDVISFHCYQDKDLPALVAHYAKRARPALCTEYMARPTSTFQVAMPILKKNRVAAINWGFVSGKTGTVWPWSANKGKDVNALRKQKDQVVQPGEAYPEPKLWFHDIYRIDGTPYSKEEIDFIRRMTSSNKNKPERVKTR
ncbi:MAG: cellulase family glycosylhydrolase [Akkermansiaceae bacterium]|nr:cellulase family glycosylhydrolase [Akkermansiaceae bacterium]